jgi:hypothetical protein
MPGLRCTCWFALVGIVTAIGCGGAYEGSPVSYSAAPEVSPSTELPAGDINLIAWQEADSSATADAVSGDQPAPRAERKIIYTASLDLYVEEFDPIPAEIETLAREHDAFIADSSIDTATGRPRSGSWTIRVPVARYDSLLDAAGKLGELQRRTADSREVTAEYYDLESRLRNKEREEARLLEHLEEATGTLEEILTVEKELARVRTEAEQVEGQLRLLKDLAALSTVTLNITEIQGYVPTESPTFATRIGRTWTESLSGLQEAGQLLVIAVVALAPWAIVVAVPVGVVILLVRLRRKRRMATA